LAADSIEVLNNLIDIEAASADAEYIRQRSTCFLSEEKRRCVFWNGHQLLCRAVNSICADLGIPTTFLEISNLPDKVFADPQGVNARSRLYEHIEDLDLLDDVSDDFHGAWLREYEVHKSKPLPQLTRSVVKRAAERLNLALKQHFGGLCVPDFTELRSAKNSISLEGLLTPDTELPEKFVFLPLQVSGDTQIKLNSDVDNLAAIRRAWEISRKEGLDLVVKPHPAERDGNALLAIMRARRDFNYHLTQCGTNALLAKASVVVTINSTVGLEALVHKKRIVTLGRAIYRDFDQTRLRKYIHRFLIGGVDYFGTKPIAREIAERMVYSGKSSRVLD
jgi:capsular polysaccharide export protein